MDLINYNFASNLHCFEQGGMKIVLDVNSGSLHSLDGCAWEVIQQLIAYKGCWEEVQADLAARYSAVELAEVLAELTQLAQEGSLFTTDVTYVRPEFPREPVVKAICLHVAHDCNLRCEYCFAGTGDFGGDRSLMSLEVGKQAIRFVLEKSRQRNHCEVDFFGGEPLVNLSVVRELVAYGQVEAAKLGKTIKFTLTTNAVLLNQQVREFLATNDISVVMSLDGRPEVNDKMRPYADGSGSYATIVKNIQAFAAENKNSSQYAVGTYYYVRGTYTHHNLDFDLDVLHMADLGIKQISVEPVVASPQDQYAFRPEDLPVLMQSYERLADAYLERQDNSDGFDFFHFNLELGKGPCLPKRLSGCGAGHEYLAVAPDGSLFPCHQFVGNPEFKVGDVFSGEIDLEMAARFRDAHVYNKPECRKCWARFFCSGGCHAAAFNFNGDLHQPYELGCKLQRKRLESAMYIKAKQALSQAIS
ncbi:MAG: thioether cross-link-forming SCIFF peptide maturase [Peptococcaceae bacterium]|nr:thioether cross-link-forming SCIFF peptide maturase [Peptococcaceae bacterium]